MKFQQNTLALLASAALALPAAASAAPLLGGLGGGAGSLPVSVGRPLSLPGAGRSLPPGPSPAIQNPVPGSAAQPASPAADAVGTISAVSGTMLTLTLPNGTKKTFTIDSAAAAKLRASNGQRVNVQTDAKGNVIAILPADQRIAATVSSVGANAVTLRLSDGRTVAFAANARQAARAGLAPGARVVVTTHDGGQTSSIALERTAAVSRTEAVRLGRNELRDLRALSTRGTQTVRGTVTRVSQDRLTIRLEDRIGDTIAIPVSAAQRANIAAGARVTIVTHDGFRSAVLTREGSSK